MKPITEWTDQELAALLLAQQWRYQDEAGKSHGRSIDSLFTEAIIDLLRLPVPLSPEAFPSAEELMREADRRHLSRPIRTHEDPIT